MRNKELWRHGSIVFSEFDPEYKIIQRDQVVITDRRGLFSLAWALLKMGSWSLARAQALKIVKAIVRNKERWRHGSIVFSEFDPEYKIVQRDQVVITDRRGLFSLAWALLKMGSWSPGLPEPAPPDPPQPA